MLFAQRSNCIDAAGQIRRDAPGARVLTVPSFGTHLAPGNEVDWCPRSCRHNLVDDLEETPCCRR